MWLPTQNRVLATRLHQLIIHNDILVTWLKQDFESMSAETFGVGTKIVRRLFANSKDDNSHDEEGKKLVAAMCLPEDCPQDVLDELQVEILKELPVDIKRKAHMSDTLGWVIVTLRRQFYALFKERQKATGHYTQFLGNFPHIT